MWTIKYLRTAQSNLAEESDSDTCHLEYFFHYDHEKHSVIVPSISTAFNLCISFSTTPCNLLVSCFTRFYDFADFHNFSKQALLNSVMDYLAKFVPAKHLFNLPEIVDICFKLTKFTFYSWPFFLIGCQLAVMWYNSSSQKWKIKR